MIDHDMRTSRRSFLKGAGMLAAGSVLPAWYVQECAAQATRRPAASTAASEQIRLGLIGCGGQGRGDARNAQRYGKVVAVLRQYE